jgi:hypothetical protein
MNSRFEYLENFLTTHNPIVKSLLNNGRPKNQIIDFFKDNFNVTNLNCDVLDFYKRYNGTIYNPKYHGAKYYWIFDWMIPLSLEEIWQNHIQRGGYGFEEKELVPLFSSMNGELLVIHKSGLEKSNAANNNYPVYYCSTDFQHDEIEPIFDNIDSMYKSFEVLFESGAFYVNKNENIIETDLDIYFDLGAKLNPNCKKYWDVYKD